MRLHIFLRLSVALVSMMSLAGAAGAAPIVFDDKTAFLTATGAAGATTIPTDPAALYFGPFVSGSLQFSVEPGDSVYPFGTGAFSPRFIGNTLSVSNKESFNIDVAGGPVYAFGFDFVEPEFDPNVFDVFIESSYGVTLKSGATTVGGFNFSRPNDSAQFVGVWMGTGLAFDRVEIRELAGDSENEFFGQFYTGSSPAEAVIPEPSTAVLSGLGLIGLLGIARRRYRRAAASISPSNSGLNSPVR